MPVRLATIGDAAAIAAAHVSAWRAAYAGLMPASVLDALNVEQRTAAWQRSLSVSSAAITTVATDASDAVVGFAFYGPTRDTDHTGQRVGELLAINLLPEVWRCGYGRQLCDRVLAHASDEGWQVLTLWVLRENIRARAFYESMGFTADGAEKTDTGLIGAPLNELRYRKQVAGSAGR